MAFKAVPQPDMEMKTCKEVATAIVETIAEACRQEAATTAARFAVDPSQLKYNSPAFHDGFVVDKAVISVYEAAANTGVLSKVGNRIRQAAAGIL